jgi:hypothetical protein
MTVDASPIAQKTTIGRLSACNKACSSETSPLKLTARNKPTHAAINAPVQANAVRSQQFRKQAKKT